MSKATVARALGGHANVSKAVREKVLAAAARSGYRPDPALAVLARRRWPHGAKSPTAVLAYIASHTREPGAIRLAPECDGAMRRAAELGYRLDVFRIQDHPSVAHIESILAARGIQGVLVQAFAESVSLDLHWDRYCAVFVGPENDAIHVHNVQADFRATVRMAVGEALRLGHRKLGFALFDYRASGTNEPILAQTALEMQRLAATGGAVPEVFQWAGQDQPADAGRFFAWMRRGRPDLVIASHGMPYHWLKNPATVGIRVPGRWRFPGSVGFISLRPDKAAADLACTDLRMEIQGREAVNLLHAQFRHGALGIPAVPMRMLIPPVFVPGRTAHRPGAAR